MPRTGCQTPTSARISEDLPEPLGPIAETVAGGEREGDVLHDEALIARRNHGDALDREPAGGRLQLGRHRLRRHLLQQAGQALPALAGRDEGFPVRDGKIDRRQRAGRQDRARDDDAGGRLLVDDEIGADREHGGLQHHAQHLGDRAEAAGDVARSLIADEIFFVGLAPALVHPAGHAHRHHHFGIATAGGGEIVALGRKPHRILRRLAGHELGDHRQPDQDDGADQRGHADHDVEGEADGEIERQPGQIEERARSHAAEEGADIVEVAQRLEALVAAADQQRQAHDGVEHALVQGLVERGADPPQDPVADHVEHALRRVEEAGDDDQADQRRNAAARQHPVVDFQHEDRPGQIEQVDHAAHQANADECRATSAQRVSKL